MRRRGRELLRLCFSLHSPLKREPLAKSPSLACGFHVTISTFSTSSSFSSSTSITPSVEKEKTSSSPSKSQRDSMILDQFGQRKLKGSSKDSKGRHPHVSTQVSSSRDNGSEKVAEKGLQNEGESTMVVANFKELGVSEELAEVLERIGDFCSK